jgi:6-phosphogluconolactonase
MKWQLYIGTFTAEFKNLRGEPMGLPSEGIERFLFDAETGALSFVDCFPGLRSPSFLAGHPTLPVLYAVERQFAGGRASEGALSSFVIEPDGTLRALARIPSGGTSPSQVSVHPSGRHAYVVNYLSGHVAAYPLDSAGRQRPADTVIAHRGSGPHPRQDRAHPHQIHPTRDGRAVLVTDLSRDSVSVYQTDTDGRLAPSASAEITLPRGTGPRHLATHPDDQSVYVIGEFDSTVRQLRATHGIPEAVLGTYSTRPTGFAGSNSCAEIVVHPRGHALYVSNRGSDTIAVFAIDSATGELEARGFVPTLGSTPRHISLDPCGETLIAANQTPGSLAVYRVEPDGGVRLRRPPVPARTPSCVLFLHPDGSAGAPDFRGT